MTSQLLTQLLQALSLLSVLLLIGTFLRAKIKLFQNLYLPASVIGGFIGMIISPEILGRFSNYSISEEWIKTYSLLPGILSVPIFAAIPLGMFLNENKNIIKEAENLKQRIESNLEILNEIKITNDEETKALLEEEIESINKEVDNLEIKLLLNGEYDENDAILEIHAGAGGTEACDWANMLKRMYTRWCEQKKYTYEIIDEQEGLEAGIKSMTMIIHGLYAFGYLKCEKGIHRLVRISPFDSGARRHTSFASVDVVPLIENGNADIEIKDSDIRIDCYCASGHGGQGVNTTPSAIRITHFPTGIVVTCQNERSQIQNKEQAMEVLKSKLYKIEMEKKETEMKNLKGEIKDINFGSQIRSYVMCPYTLVKDHRTNTEKTNVDKVLDGDIDDFINDNLKSR